jgi:hypothetical protein
MTAELFPNTPLSARVFIFTSNTTLSTSESTAFQEGLRSFVSNWKAHGSSLDASFMLIANRVLIIVVDEIGQTATGCSIDSLNRFLQSSSFDWFARTWVLHNSDSPTLDADWSVCDLADFHESCRSGEISMDEFVLNTTVLSVIDLHKNLVQTVSESWHNQML